MAEDTFTSFATREGSSLEALSSGELERQQSIYLLMRSEEVFVATLHTAVDVRAHPTLSCARQSPAQGYLVPIRAAGSSVLEDRARATVFANLEDVMRVHDAFLDALYQRRGESKVTVDNVADIVETFVRRHACRQAHARSDRPVSQVSSLGVYRHYSISQETSQATLAAALQPGAPLADFIKVRCACACNTLDA